MYHAAEASYRSNPNCASNVAYFMLPYEQKR